jgi:hypothetical protein
MAAGLMALESCHLIFIMTKPFIQSGEPLNDFLRSFWQRQADAAERETPDYRHPPLPLARIKKVMKSDPDVKVRLSPYNLYGLLVPADDVEDDSCRWYVSLQYYFFNSFTYTPQSTHLILQSMRK